MATIPEALAIAARHQQAGRLLQAEQIYRQILTVEPNHSDAWHLLGILAHQAGRYEMAIEHFGRAIRSNGRAAAYHDHLGESYRALHQFSEAAVCYQQALELNPCDPEAHNNLGIVTAVQGRLNEAAACFQRALQFRPSYSEAHNNLGNVRRVQGELDEAAACFQRALQLMPSYPEAHNNLGNVRYDQRRLDEAAVCYERALLLKPHYAEAYLNLGIVRRDQRRLDEAAGCFERALRLVPHHPEAHNNLGTVRKDQERLEEAADCFRRTLQLRPEYAEAHHNLGLTLSKLGNLEGAVLCHRRALERKPDLTAARAALVTVLLQVCRWDDLIPHSLRLIDAVEKGDETVRAAPIPPFTFISLPTATTPRQQWQCAQQWASWKLTSSLEQESRVQVDPEPNARADRATAGFPRKPRLTIGYLSSDFRQHATAYLITELLEKHDRERFEVFGYSFGPDDGSPIRRRIVKACARFADLRDTSFVEAAERITADEVDILVDLNGYTQFARSQILALRPAPVQVSYLGYPGTMGAPFMDYILVDDFVVPADQQPFYTEQLVHLPGCYQVNDGRREIAARTPSRAECGLPAAGFVFCCFNNSYKITPVLFDVWMGLLTHVPGSVLWLLEGNPSVPANLRREAEARGVAGERLVFAEHLPLADHLARYRLADLFLDTVPFNAHTTASDALWAGCPVLTLSGEAFASRVAGSLLRAIGLPELIMTGLDEYRERALQLASEPDLLGTLRRRLADNRRTSALFNAGQFARNLETAYLRMWKIHSSGERPRAFAVNRI